jgi:hypothetical protein
MSQGTNHESSIELATSKINYSSDVDEVDVSELKSRPKTHIFQDPEVAEYYKKYYNDHGYEGRDHFDPELEWTPEEERKVVWETDLKVLLWAFIMFSALDFDRSNISQAMSDNLLTDLNFSSDDYNLGRLFNCHSSLQLKCHHS